MNVTSYTYTVRTLVQILWSNAYARVLPSTCAYLYEFLVYLRIFPLTRAHAHSATTTSRLHMSEDTVHAEKFYVPARLKRDTITSAITHMHFGWWRSLVAHLTGGQGVAGSNPVHPTMFFLASILLCINETTIQTSLYKKNSPLCVVLTSTRSAYALRKATYLCYNLRVFRKLCLKKVIICPACTHKLRMRALFDNTPLIKHKNSICIHNGG